MRHKSRRSGGRGLICEVNVDTITPRRVCLGTTRECLGSAGDPPMERAAPALLRDQIIVLTQAGSAVTQCNDSINGGGGTLRCSVKITNNSSVSAQ